MCEVCEMHLLVGVSGLSFIKLALLEGCVQLL